MLLQAVKAETTETTDMRYVVPIAGGIKNSPRRASLPHSLNRYIGPGEKRTLILILPSPKAADGRAGTRGPS